MHAHVFLMTNASRLGVPGSDPFVPTVSSRWLLGLASKGRVLPGMLERVRSQDKQPRREILRPETQQPHPPSCFQI